MLFQVFKCLKFNFFSRLNFFFCWFWFFKQAKDLLCRPRQPQICHNPSARASQMLGLQACITPDHIFFFCESSTCQRMKLSEIKNIFEVYIPVTIIFQCLLRVCASHVYASHVCASHIEVKNIVFVVQDLGCQLCKCNSLIKPAIFFS